MISLEEDLINCQNQNHLPSEYMDCRFVLGSVADVETLRGLAIYVIIENRRPITPQIFETILFLKYNCSCSDPCLVGKSILFAKHDRLVAETVNGLES